MDKTALITGASKGLGLTLATFLARRGYKLIIDARGAAELRRAFESLNAHGTVVKAVRGDVTDATHREQLIAEAARMGGLDLLVNNASTLGDMTQLSQMDPGALRRTFEVNVMAPLQLVQGLVPLLERHNGLVVNISSDAARGGYPRWGGYGASKAALDLLTVTLANEGISAVSVDPGDMRTAMHQAAFPGEDISDRPLPEVTLPFWAWLFGQQPEAVSGGRFEAQAELWQVPA